MKRLGMLAFFILWGVLFCAQDVFAHARTYVWTEEYHTIPKGGAEVEGWTTFDVPDGSVTNANEIEYQTELEYGVTDHWVVSHYERLITQNQPGNDDATNYEGFKFETKYRFGEKGKYWLDPLLYAEWATNFRNHDNPNALEWKLVLSKDLGKWNVTYNQIMENELGKGGRTTHEFSAGANYEVVESIRVGGEFTGEYWAPGSHRNKLSMGPTIAYEHKYFWVAIGALFGLNREADDHEVRVIVGIPIG